MFKLAITGGMASGKSTASMFFKKKGGFIFDADLEAKKHLQYSVALQHKMLNAFGPDLKKKSGKIDLKTLSERAFSNTDLHQILNGIMWPEIYLLIEKKIIQKTKEGVPLFVVDAALVFEANFSNLFDAILLITADEEIRIKRAIRRHSLSINQIEKRMNLQMPEVEKKQLTKYVIYNNNTIDKLQGDLEIFYQKTIFS